MVETKTITIGVLTALVTTLVILGSQNILNKEHLELNQTYFCESRSLVMDCLRFSTSGLRCYPDLESIKGYRDCIEGWTLVTDDTNFTKYERKLYITDLQDCKTIKWNSTSKVNCTNITLANSSNVIRCQNLILENSKQECEDNDKMDIKIEYSELNTTYNFRCDYSSWGKCSYNDESDHIECDSKYDGNADGICQPGEECIYLFNATQQYPYISNKVDRLRNDNAWIDINKMNVECVQIE